MRELEMRLADEIAKAEEAAYLKAQEESGLKVGDIVKILPFTHPDKKLGWRNSWVGSMSNRVGEVHKIEGIRGNMGIRLMGSFEYYPFYCLEKVVEPKAETLKREVIPVLGGLTDDQRKAFQETMGLPIESFDQLINELKKKLPIKGAVVVALGNDLGPVPPPVPWDDEDDG